MGGRTSSTFQTLYAAETKFVQDLTKNNCVVVFSKTSCSYCKKVKKIFNENSIDHVVIELDQRDDCEKMQQVLLGLTGARTVPRVFINGHCIGGASDTERLYKENQLLGKIQECQEHDI